MAGFIQIIDYTTSRFDEIKQLADELRDGGQGGPSGAISVTVTQDRDRPNHYITVAEFESYEKAMENSNNPATTEFAAKMAKLVDGEPTFINLDVVDRM
jgi:quinol monooxygenase YgiN